MSTWFDFNGKTVTLTIKDVSGLGIAPQLKGRVFTVSITDVTDDGNDILIIGTSRGVKGIWNISWEWVDTIVEV